jgi:hypothetical protein
MPYFPILHSSGAQLEVTILTVPDYKTLVFSPKLFKKKDYTSQRTMCHRQSPEFPAQMF